MSWIPGADPSRDPGECPNSVEMIIVPRTADLGGFEVRRVLPFRNKRMVGPFIFWDEMGPGEFVTGQGIDVLPHPHIGLSTVTYLSRGSLEHRDSLGSNQIIEPGDVNLMGAGSGITHSERTANEVRKSPSSLAGIQSWLASPQSTESGAPSFRHTPQSELPLIEDQGTRARVILGEAFGEKSPVAVDWPTLYLDVEIEAGQKFPLSADTEERAIYVLAGSVLIENVECPSQRMLVLRPGVDATVFAQSNTRLMVLGGAAMDGPRFIWWNFVASTREQIEEAKDRWRTRRFPAVVGDEDEFVPLPE